MRAFTPLDSRQNKQGSDFCTSVHCCGTRNLSLASRRAVALLGLGTASRILLLVNHHSGVLVLDTGKTICLCPAASSASLACWPPRSRKFTHQTPQGFFGDFKFSISMLFGMFPNKKLRLFLLILPNPIYPREETKVVRRA